MENQLVNLCVQRTEEKRKKLKLWFVEQRRNIPSEESGIRPLDLFPKEVWEVIILDQSVDLKWILNNLSADFACILSRDKLFQMILPVLVETRFKRMEWCITFKDLIQLRVICKEFRYFVDQRLAQIIKDEVRFSQVVAFTPRFEMNKEEDRARMQKLNRMYVFDKKANEEMFFVPQALCLYLSNFSLEFTGLNDLYELGAFYLDYTSAASGFLKQNGGNLLKFCLGMTDYVCESNRVFTELDVYNFLCDCAVKMPRLLWLSFEISRIGNGWDFESITDQLARGCIRRPFPTIPSLERITILSNNACRHGNCLIARSMLRSNQHIKYLEIESEGGHQFHLSVPTREIKRLHLEGIKVTNQSHKTLTLDMVKDIVRLDWQLTVIDLSVSAPNTDMIDLFKMLNCFPSLEDVRLSRLDILVDNSKEFGNLDLVQLKCFSIEFEPDINYYSEIGHFMNLDFLIPCANLRFINWKMLRVNHEQLREKLFSPAAQCESLNFRGGLQVGEEMNLWKAFPELEQIDVHITFDRSSNPMERILSYERNVSFS